MRKKIFKYSLITTLISIILGFITNNEIFFIPLFISLFILFIVSILLLETIGNKKCPYCQEWINKNATKCPKCQSILSRSK